MADIKSISTVSSLLCGNIVEIESFTSSNTMLNEWFSMLCLLACNIKHASMLFKIFLFISAASYLLFFTVVGLCISRNNAQFVCTEISFWSWKKCASVSVLIFFFFVFAITYIYIYMQWKHYCFRQLWDIEAFFLLWKNLLFFIFHSSCISLCNAN